MNVFLSSTVVDLKAHRKAIARLLRQMGHDVLAMEEHVASDNRPLDICLRYVEEADVYVGIFAWRYGYCPETETHQNRSITEIEYRHARDKGKPCLIFLSEPSVQWPPIHIDGVIDEGRGGRKIANLRSTLMKEHLVGFFDTPDELASLASVAVRRLEIDSAVKGATLDFDYMEFYWYHVFLKAAGKQAGALEAAWSAFIIPI